ncbi:hypothetical protein E4J66_06310 [Actinomyces viscosus]|uniref:Uncharacterized protein n=1 Tax=Actinomyces viscosus TaxID=1656 RepID=A0A3S4ZAE2_ACTVI|nr:hypothetical protein [Actinomyces viscosus]TFH52820.1 hypothetical protein E4J66_06310 [Actinomyces viscosus]VEI18459.1 Uncharacterised protein [Actinomyces viscosus]
MNDVVLGAVANVHTRLLQAGLVPVDSGPVAPPGVATKTDTIIGWSKWVCFAICIFGLVAVAAKLAINNRRGEGEDHAKALGFVMAAAIVCGAAGSLIQALQ